MNIIVVGLSHKTAAVEIREKVAFSPTQMEKPLHALVSIPDITEGVIVSTCNRVEIYATTRDIAGGIARLKRFLADYHNFPLETLEPHLYSYHGEAATRHVFRVASSLDSMVVGEPQILGQIKTSYAMPPNTKVPASFSIASCTRPFQWPREYAPRQRLPPQPFLWPLPPWSWQKDLRRSFRQDSHAHRRRGDV